MDFVFVLRIEKEDNYFWQLTMRGPMQQLEMRCSHRYLYPAGHHLQPIDRLAYQTLQMVNTSLLGTKMNELFFFFFCL